jgi:hypothetical protein
MLPAKPHIFPNDTLAAGYLDHRRPHFDFRKSSTAEITPSSSS